MIVFKWIRWKNLFSYGDTWTKIQLDRSQSTVITGKNGVGKSAFFEALHIGLFGQSIRPIKKQKWVCNKNNKGLLIEISLSDGEDDYLISRGVKPDMFTIVKNGQPLNERSSVREQQNVLNRDILKSDKVGFQITSLISKSGIQMFMSLKAEERRKFIDNMLGTSVFTEMSKSHKIGVEALKGEVDKTLLSLTRTSALIESKESEIVSTKSIIEASEKARVESLKVLVDQADSRLESLETEFSLMQAIPAVSREQIEDHEKKKASLDQYTATFHQKSETLKKEIENSSSLVDPEIEALRKRLDELTSTETPNIEAILNALGAERKKVKALGDIKLKLEAKLINLRSNRDSLKGGFCSECKQEVSDEHVKTEQEKLEPEIEKLSSAILELNEKMAGVESSIEEETRKLDDAKEVGRNVSSVTAQLAREERNFEARKIEKVNSLEGELQRLIALGSELEERVSDSAEYLKSGEDRKASEIKSHISKIEKAKESVREATQNVLQAPPKDDGLLPLREELKALKKAMEKISSIREEQASLQEYNSIITQMLKDGGFKTVVVKKFLPIVNRIVNEKLAELGFFAKFTLDENFDEKILYNGIEDMEFHQFSEGEKLRINLSLILAWREIARMQGRMHSNLLMFDESLDQSLDDDGYESLTGIFKLLDHLNVFIISHNSTKLENFVRSKLSVIKTNGFSRLGDAVS